MKKANKSWVATADKLPRSLRSVSPAPPPELKRYLKKSPIMPLPGIASDEYPKIADALGLNLPWVWDLASYPDEARMNLSVSQVIEIARTTGLSVPEILGIEMPEPVEPVTPEDFRTRLLTAVEESGCTIGEFEDRIGWEIGEVMATPDRIVSIYSWDGLTDIACALNLTPWALMPSESTRDNKP
jgi:hypothetical protein